jgi:integrase
MATITKIGKRYRALVRKGGRQPPPCATFGTHALAKAWAATIEAEIDQLKASGFLKTGALTVGDLIDRYTRELYPLKQWSPSKTRELRILKKHFGTDLVSKFDHARIVEVFTAWHTAGTGGVGMGSRMSYLLKVMETARDLWRLGVPLDAVRGARGALKAAGMITVSKERDRRVTDAEIAAVIGHLEKMQTALPVRDLIHFAVASAMRVSEITRLRWVDLNEADRTIWVRDRKHPKKKIGNDSQVPLLDFSGHDAFKIVMRQPRTKDCVFPYNCRTVGKYFIDAALFLEIEDLNFHDLRHEAISRMFESKHRYSIPEVALVSGHRDWGHLRRYTKLRAVDLHRVKAA